MPVAEGKEQIKANVPEGTDRKLDTLRLRLQDEARRRGEDLDPFADRGVFLAWLVDRWELLLGLDERLDHLEARERRVAARERAAAEREATLRDREAKLTAEIDQANARNAAAEQEISRRVGIAQDVRDLFGELMAEGVGKGELIAWGRALQAAGIDPYTAIEVLRREDTQGLLGWLRRLHELRAEAERELAEREQQKARLAEEIEPRRQAAEKLGAEAERLAKLLAERQAALQAATEAVRHLQATAQDLGVYLDALRQADVRRIERLPAATGKLLAGVILTAVVQTYGDEALQVPPGGGRFVPVPLALSEIPYLLAPREAYAEMQRAQARREARAEVLAEVAPADEDGGDA